jgi:hypothetical protein
VWVANYGGNPVTELDRSTGHLVRELPPARYGFNSPWGVSSDVQRVAAGTGEALPGRSGLRCLWKRPAL